MQKPFSVWLAVLLLWLAYVLDLMLLLAYALKEFVASTALLTLSYQTLLAFFLYRTATGSAKSRLIFTILFVGPMVRTLTGTTWEQSEGDIIQLTIMLFPLVPLTMLWSGTSSKWFKTMKMGHGMDNTEKGA